MKIVNIFGLVVAVHVAVLLMIFAIPGCRTTPRPGDPVVAEVEPAPMPVAAAPSQPVREMSPADLNPPLASRSAPSNGTVAYGAPSGATRTSPTRPDASAGGSSVSTPFTPAPVPAPAPATSSYTVVRGDSLWAVAKKHGTTVRELAAANGLSANASLKVGQTLKLPAAAGAATSSAAASPASSAARSSSGGATASEGTTYVVRSGDTLSVIARRHQTTVPALKAMNNLRGDLVRVGDTLVIPQEGSTVGASAPVAATPARTAEPARTVQPTPTPAAATTAASSSGSRPATSPASAAGGTTKHIVAPGESLGTIARRYGVNTRELATINNIADPSRIPVGQELVIPGAATPAQSRPPVPTQYPASFQPATESAPAATPSEDEVPVIRVEENVPTIRVQPVPSEQTPDQGQQPSVFN